ncbi:MAG: ABC transporter ATP-binding protein, partial [Reichenbachiella sp.]
LMVTKQADLPNHDRVVHAESTFSGHTIVEENITAQESNMNLEILFNAVVNNKEKIQKIFKN